MPGHPLSTLSVRCAAWPAAQLAGELLAALGASVVPLEAPPALVIGERSVAARHTTPDEDWRDTGLQSLTGRPGGPSLSPDGRPATLARALGLAIEALDGPQVDGAAVLGARLDRMPLRRGGTRSAGGAARLLACADGWIALGLPRADDRQLVPALVGEDAPGDPWEAVAHWAAGRSEDEVVARASLLGLAVGGLSERATAADEVPWTLVRRAARAGGAGARRPNPRVVNLGALWAAPLAAQLLQRAGADVLDVVSPMRPDPAPPALRSLLHSGHRSEAVDLTTAAGRRRLAGLLAGADVVIEASRPRALRQLGLDAATVMADGRLRTWLRITGHGPDSDRIAFGDDAAVAGGLVARDEEGPVFAGDAIADPLSGLVAALLALACARSPDAWIVDVPMAAVAAAAAHAR